MKQQCAPGLAEGQVAQFIEHHQIQARQTLGNSTGLVHQLFVLQCIDQIHHRVEAHLLAVPRQTRHTQRRGHPMQAQRFQTGFDINVHGRPPQFAAQYPLTGRTGQCLRVALPAVANRFAQAQVCPAQAAGIS